MKGRQTGVLDVAEGIAAPDGGTPPRSVARGGQTARRPRRILSVEQKVQFLRAYEASHERIRDFCAKHGLSTKSLCNWRWIYKTQGESGLAPKPNPRNRGGHGYRVYTPEDRRQAVESFKKSGVTREEFARMWGVSKNSLAAWVAAYQTKGPKGLEGRRPGRPRGTSTVPAAVRQEVVAVKRRFPDFGLRKVRDFLRRFYAIRVSAGSVRRTLKEAQIPPPPAAPKRRRKPPVIRRFERSKPGELWQSDITVLRLARHSQQAYLTAFLDDYSRYIVAWDLRLTQRQELVIETLLAGTSRFGKPEEVLTDQGRQYFAWRGKSHFQKVLAREGIAHVVSRAHHPETLGKIERFWETVGQEFWERVQPRDLAEARERLGHFIAHYNHFRPHQGIDGSVPADRFFGVDNAVRRELEAAMDENELAVALGHPPRKPVFLVGQIGGEPVSLHGEKGQLVIRTSEGTVHRIGMDDMGMPEESGHEQGGKDERDTTRDGSGHGGGARNGVVHGKSGEAAADPAGTQASAGVAAEAGDRGPGAVGGGHGGGAGAGAPDGLGAPGDVGGALLEAGVGGAPGDSAAPGVAAVAAGGVGYGGGTPQATEEAGKGGGDGGGGRGGPEAAQAADSGAGEQAGSGAGADRGAKGDAGESRTEPAGRAPGGEGEKKEGQAGTAKSGGDGWQPGCSDAPRSDGMSGPASPGGSASR